MQPIIFLSLTIAFFSIQGQATIPSTYTCNQNNSIIQLTQSSSNHSAWNSMSNCSLQQCIGSSNNNNNNSCLLSSTSCYKYRSFNNILFCATAILCSIVDTCDNLTNTCSSNNSVCVINSCCSPQSICLPLISTSLCPSASLLFRNTIVRRYDVETNSFCIVDGSTSPHIDAPNLEIAAHSNFAQGCGSRLTRSLLTLDEISYLSPTASIRSANITLFGSDPGSFQAYSLTGEANVTNEVFIKRVLTPWDAYTVIWITQPNTTDTNAVIIPTTRLTDTTPNTELYNFTIDITQLARDVHAGGPGNNHGIMFQMKTKRKYRAMAFCSFQHFDTQRHPRITIET